MAFKSCRRGGAPSEIIVSNSFFTFCESICTLIHKLTTIHQKAALLFNIHPCILMGYFSNNAADNNMRVCYIPAKSVILNLWQASMLRLATPHLYFTFVCTKHIHTFVFISWCDFYCFNSELMICSILS